MRRICYLLLVALLPVVLQAQADDKLKAAASGGDTKSMILLGECYENGSGVEVDSAQAVRWFQKAANMGDGDAWIKLSAYYVEGVYFPKDTAKFLEIRKEWAAKGLPEGLAALGRAYVYGCGVETDSVKALELFQQAASKGSKSAYVSLAIAYQNGMFRLPKDDKMFLKYAQLAWNQKDYYAGTLLADYYFRNAEYKKGWEYLKEAAKWGDLSARMLTAESYFMGSNGVKEDEKKAIQMILEIVSSIQQEVTLSRAGAFLLFARDTALVDTLKALDYWNMGAERKYASCFMHLAEFYANGMDYEKTHAYALLAEQYAKNDYVGGLSCRMLGGMYIDGLSVEPDTAKGVQWFSKGVEEYASSDCALAMALLYELNDDFKSSVRFYDKADQLGDANALVYLGKLYARNNDFKNASACFQKAIDKGNTDGYYWMSVLTDDPDYLKAGYKKGNVQCIETLGILYAEGAFGKPDYKKAQSYFLEAGSSNAWYKLGLLYLDGKLGKNEEKNLKMGLDYIRKSVDAGNVEAIYFLGYCYENGKFVDSVDHVKAVEQFKLLADNGVAAGQFKMGLYHELGDGGVVADSAKAVEYYQLAADQGHGLAMCYLADFYRIGQYLPVDKQKAFNYYLKAHELGEETGTYYVGRSYLEGCGVEIDSAAAIPYLKQAAAQGVGNASYRLAEFYNYGYASVEQNSDSAIAYYLQAHQNGNSDASYYIGTQLLNEGMYDAAVTYLAQAVRDYHPKAIIKYAMCLQQGVGLQADPATAVEMLQYVVRNHADDEAYESLGLAYLQGVGVIEDEAMGKAYLDTAAHMGRANAQFVLGLCYLNGWGCTVDTNEALHYFEMAAKQGHIRSINNLGDFYEARQEFKSAVAYYQQAVELGSLEGYCNLGYCYQEGQGVLLNSQKAFEYYKMAADHGYVRGILLVAESYLNGMYVEKNVSEAMVWLEKAAQNGNMQAMYHLGSIYAEGDDGVEVDLKAAKSWFKKSAELGYAPAEIALERLSKK